MAQPPRTPPRFVPTLTEVVQVPGATPPPGALAVSARTTVVAPSQLPRIPPTTPPVTPPVTPPATSPVNRPGTPAEAPATPVPRARPPLPSAQPPAVMVQRPAATSMAPPAMAPSQPARRPLPEGMEEYMVHRVMQRVDVILERRLRDAIATVVQEQTRSVLPRLREEIESVVRHTVYEAVADELASGSPTASKG